LGIQGVLRKGGIAFNTGIKIMTQNKYQKNHIRYRTVRRLKKLGLIKVCNKCGGSEYLEVHHKDGNVFNGDLSNLQVLCYKCHDQVHGRHYSGDTGKPFSRKVKKAEKALRLASVPKIDFKVVVNEMGKLGWTFHKLSTKISFFYKNDNMNLIVDVRYLMPHIRANGMDNLEEYCEGNAVVWGFVNVYCEEDDTD